MLESWAHPCRLRQLVEKQLQAEFHQVVIQKYARLQPERKSDAGERRSTQERSA